LVLIVVALLASPAAAFADPPILNSIDIAPGNHHPTFNWTLPVGDKGQVQSVLVESAKSSDTNADGYFLQKNVVSYNSFGAGDTRTTFTDEFNYSLGTFFGHVAGHDPKCVGGVCDPVQFSNVMSFDVVSPPPPGGGGGGGGGGVGADKFAPLETLIFAAAQKLEKLYVTASISEAGALTASATVNTGGASKVYRFKKVSRSVGANVKTKLRLKLSKKNLRAVKKALKRGKRLKAKITVTARDKAGNARSQKATVKLKR
jgi:hypothetical protein